MSDRSEAHVRRFLTGIAMVFGLAVVFAASCTVLGVKEPGAASPAQLSRPTWYQVIVVILAIGALGLLYWHDRTSWRRLCQRRRQQKSKRVRLSEWKINGLLLCGLVTIGLGLLGGLTLSMSFPEYGNYHWHRAARIQVTRLPGLELALTLLASYAAYFMLLYDAEQQWKLSLASEENNSASQQSDIQKE